MTPRLPSDAPGPPAEPEVLARLARLGVAVGAAHLAPPDPERRRPGAAPDASSWAPTSPAVTPIEAAVPGRTVENAHGRCYVSTVHRHAGEVHAGEALAAALDAGAGSLAALARRSGLAELDPARTAFLDTETTGLHGGTGTYAFLIGAGRFIGSTFQVRQFFMRDPAEERAQLAEVAGWLADCTGLVTFNGRSFDVPLLTTRYTLHRQRFPAAADLHLDLLPLARRLWRRRLASCALTALERDILGLEREDDVPGWLIPYRYLTYQRDGDARPLVGVFQHNALDILSMVSLLARIARAYERPAETLDQPADWLSLGRAYADAGDPDRAIVAYRDALARGLAPADADEALERLSLAAKRAGRWDHALAVWSDLAEATAARRLYPFEELAKYWEHHAAPPDPARALAYARRARDLVAAGALRPRRGTRRALAELDHRIARLGRRLGNLP